jgi:EAL domain-containing protein (putative c-di-GMP-specific phosphodiesterase class I)
MTDTRNLLLIDENPTHAADFREALLNAKDGQFHCKWVQTLSQGVERLREKTIWAIFASLSLLDSQGLDTIDTLLKVAPDVPILVMGGAADEDLSTEALRRGAKDYLLNGHIGACSFGRAIRNMAERKTVAENVSSLEFRSEGFIESLRAILRDTGLDPRYLELELTESVLMQDATSSASALNTLKSIGVHLAVDDFGTGYSSLSYLKRFPIDCLKIDQSFVHDITTDTDDATIVSAVITMAKTLRKFVVAEGVETEEQITFLQAHGCDEAQGYYFSKPVIAHEIAKLLETGIAPFASHISVNVPV